MSLQESDRAAAETAVAPRVSLHDIETAIGARFDTTADKALAMVGYKPLDLLSICILVMKNGFVVIGKSAPASPENFNAELGKKFGNYPFDSLLTENRPETH